MSEPDVRVVIGTVEAQRRLLTDAYAAAAWEIRRQGGSWADVESYLNMAPGKAKRAYGPLIEAAARHDGK